MNFMEALERDQDKRSALKPSQTGYPLYLVERTDFINIGEVCLYVVAALDEESAIICTGDYDAKWKVTKIADHSIYHAYNLVCVDEWEA